MLSRVLFVKAPTTILKGFFYLIKLQQDNTVAELVLLQNKKLFIIQPELFDYSGLDAM